MRAIVECFVIGLVLVGVMACLANPPTPPQASDKSANRISECGEQNPAALIPDPRRWIQKCAGEYAPTNPEPTAALDEFERDIDLDGIPELFIIPSVALGNAGGPYFVFQKAGDRYRYLGSLFLHRRAFRILPMDDDQQPKMIVYRRASVSEGELCTIKYTGREFKVIDSETIDPLGKDRAKYQQLFE